LDIQKTKDLKREIWTTAPVGGGLKKTILDKGQSREEKTTVIDDRAEQRPRIS